MDDRYALPRSRTSTTIPTLCGQGCGKAVQIPSPGPSCLACVRTASDFSASCHRQARHQPQRRAAACLLEDAQRLQVEGVCQCRREVRSRRVQQRVRLGAGQVQRVAEGQVKPPALQHMGIAPAQQQGASTAWCLWGRVTRSSISVPSAWPIARRSDRIGSTVSGAGPPSASRSRLCSRCSWFNKASSRWTRRWLRYCRASRRRGRPTSACGSCCNTPAACPIRTRGWTSTPAGSTMKMGPWPRRSASAAGRRLVNPVRASPTTTATPWCCRPCWNVWPACPMRNWCRQPWRSRSDCASSG